MTIIPNPLTMPLSKKYSSPAAAQSVAGVSSPLDDTGVQAPRFLLGVFLRLGVSLYDGARWEASGLAAFQCPRSANPTCAVTILFSSDWWRLVNNQILETIMNLPILQVCDSATPEQLTAQIRALCSQSHALSLSIHEITQHRRSFSEHFDSVNWLLMQLELNLELQEQLLERLGEVS